MHDPLNLPDFATQAGVPSLFDLIMKAHKERSVFGPPVPMNERLPLIDDPIQVPQGHVAVPVEITVKPNESL